MHEWMGHNDVRITQIYTHVLKLNGYAVKSPADKLWSSALKTHQQRDADNHKSAGGIRESAGINRL